MKRTQIQLPDRLYEAAHQVAVRREISLAELVRRGLEYMIAVSPGAQHPSGNWKLPPSLPLHAKEPFKNDAWREDIHLSRLQAAEPRASYDRDNKS